MRILSHALVAFALLAISSCAALDKVVSMTDPETGDVVETTVGNVAADTVEQLGGTGSGVLADALGVATGNPVIGVGGGAALLALLGAGASRLRRPVKRKGKGKA